MTSSFVFPAKASATVASDRLTFASITKVLVLSEGVFFAKRVIFPLLLWSSGSVEGVKDVTLASYENFLSLSNTSTLILSISMLFSPSGVRERVRGLRSPKPSNDRLTGIHLPSDGISTPFLLNSSKGSLHPCIRGIPIIVARKANIKV